MNGVSMLESTFCKPGAVIVTDSPRVLLWHPLDRISWEHEGDALARLDAAMDWILQSALRRLDSAGAA